MSLVDENRMCETGGDVAGARRVPVLRWRTHRLCELDDWVSEEVAVALEFNGISHAVMLATPCDLEDFALGFGISEGIFTSAADLYGCEVVQGSLGTTVRMEVSSRSFNTLKHRRRTLAGRTGCGLCGVESLAQVVRAVPAIPTMSSDRRFQGDAIVQAMRSLRHQQRLNQLTGSLHAAAWCNAEGDVLVLREDVGRHNALDKLIGALARAGMTAEAGFIAVTSRASIEMVQKAATAGVALMAAVSAPTQLAVNMAQCAGMTLVGLVRQEDFVMYTHPQRVVLAALANAGPSSDSGKAISGNAEKHSRGSL